MTINKYSNLSDENKKLFKEICDNSFGKSITFTEYLQPLYFTEYGDIIDPDYMISEFIKFIRKEKLLKINDNENK